MGDWQNLSGFGREQESWGKKEKKVETEKEKEEEELDVMTRW